MADPLTVNRNFAIPTRGSDAGTWDIPLNGNWSSLDNMLGAPNVISVSSGTVNLTPTQISFGTIFLTGSLSAHVHVVFPAVQGWWTIYNGCTVNTFGIFVSSGTSTIQIGIPPGEFVDVLINGNTPYYRSFGRINGVEIWAGYSSMPVWCSLSTPPPYVLADGSTYNISTYPFSGKILGSAFGGDGVTTFGVPDLRGRVPLPYDNTGSRITVSGCGVNGQSLGAAGGGQSSTLATANLPPYTPSGSNSQSTGGAYYSGQNIVLVDTSVNTTGGSFSTSSLTIPYASSGHWSSVGQLNVTTNPQTFTGTPQGGSSTPFSNVQPAQVTGIAVIRLM